MTPIHATVPSADRFRDQYRLIIQLVPSEFLGPFERLRFKKNPYCGSFGTSVDKSWLTLDYRKDPGFKAGEAFPLWRTDLEAGPRNPETSRRKGETSKALGGGSA